MVVTVVLLIVAAACSLFKEEVDLPQTFELRMDRPADAALQFSVLKDVDTNSEALQKYNNSMASFSIRGITYSIENFSGNSDAVISGNIEFAAAGSSDFTVLNTITDLHLRKMNESSQENSIGIYDAAVREKLTKLLQQGSPITFRLNATTTDSPIAASLVIKINSQMTVEL